MPLLQFHVFKSHASSAIRIAYTETSRILSSPGNACIKISVQLRCKNSASRIIFDSLTDKMEKFSYCSLVVRHIPTYPGSPKFRYGDCPKKSWISNFQERAGQKSDFDENCEILAKVFWIHPLEVRTLEFQDMNSKNFSRNFAIFVEIGFLTGPLLKIRNFSNFYDRPSPEN